MIVNDLQRMVDRVANAPLITATQFLKLGLASFSKKLAEILKGVFKAITVSYYSKKKKLTKQGEVYVRFR